MPSFTIESSYRRLAFRHKSYEAPDIEAASRQAIADDDWQSQKDDDKSCSATFLTGIWAGIDTAYQVVPLPVPSQFAEAAASADQSVADLSAAAPTTPPVTPRCRHCGSGQISRDAMPAGTRKLKAGFFSPPTPSTKRCSWCTWHHTRVGMAKATGLRCGREEKVPEGYLSEKELHRHHQF